MTSTPPLPPDITRQQQQFDPAAASMSMAQSMGAAREQAAFDVSGFVQATMTEVALKLGQMAKVLKELRPDLLPTLEVMGKAGQTLMTELAPQQQPGPEADAVLAQSPDPKGPSGSVSMG